MLKEGAGLGGKSIYSYDKNDNRIFYYGLVESITDESDGYIVRARIKGIDDILATQQLPTAFPLIPKFTSVQPKVGELVMIFIPDFNNKNQDRMYIGPIISQPQKLNKDKFFYSATSLLDTGKISPEPAPTKIPKTVGVYPNKQDFSVQGRGNNDIIFKNNELVLRNNKFIRENESDIPIFNKFNISYIQFKSGVEEEDSEEKKDVLNLVSDKINLLTHKDGNPRFNITNQDNLISDKEMLKILKDAHPLVFGDILIEFIIKFRDAFISHVHPYHGKTPENLSGNESIKELLNFNLKTLLSKNIKIN